MPPRQCMANWLIVGMNTEISHLTAFQAATPPARAIAHPCRNHAVGARAARRKAEGPRASLTGRPGGHSTAYCPRKKSRRPRPRATYACTSIGNRCCVCTGAAAAWADRPQRGPAQRGLQAAAALLGQQRAQRVSGAAGELGVEVMSISRPGGCAAGSGIHSAANSSVTLAFCYVRKPVRARPRPPAHTHCWAAATPAREAHRSRTCQRIRQRSLWCPSRPPRHRASGRRRMTDPPRHETNMCPGQIARRV